MFGIPFLFLMSFVVTVVLCRKTEEIAYVQMITLSQPAAEINLRIVLHTGS